MRRPTVAVRRLLGDAVDAVGAVRILRLRGLLNPLRPGAALRTLRVARRGGPFAAMIADPARRTPATVALLDSVGELTYGELDSRSNAVARGLLDLGITPGSVAGLLCRDHRDAVIALVAMGKAGVRPLPLNTGFAGPQLVQIARRENMSALVFDAEFIEMARRVPAEVRRIVAVGDGPCGLASIAELAATHSGAALPLPAVSAGMVLLTSGSTGLPKGAGRARISPLLSARLLDRIPLTREGTAVIATPLFHASGLGLFILCMSLGKRVVLLSGRFDPSAVLDAVSRHRADTLVVVPTMLSRMLEIVAADPDRFDRSALRILVCAGAPVSPHLAQRTAAVFGDVLYNMYGSTEVALVSVATPAECVAAPGTVGRPPSGGRIGIYDAERRPVIEPHIRGTLFADNGMGFVRYTDGSDKERLGDLISTGDIGHIDESGLLFVDGREDDMIISGGENVYPLEVEHLLAARADVDDVAAIGVHDPDFGQRLRVFAVAAAGRSPTADEIRDYVKARLARHAVPREVLFVARIPRNAAGKVVRADLEGLMP